MILLTAKSSHTKQDELKTPLKTDPCNYCGKRGHGKNAPLRIRKSKCHAYGTTCAHCGQANHFEAVCCNKGRASTQLNDPSNSAAGEAEGTMFDALCTATSLSHSPRENAITLDHHLFHHLSDCWVQQSSQSQPFVTLTAIVHPDNYAALGFKAVTFKPMKTQLSAATDTGCQSCLASMKVIPCLSLCEDDLIPVTMHMHATNNHGISILGAVILQFSSCSKSGQPLESWQIIYVTNDADKLFLSWKSSAQGMISPSFPTLGEALHSITVTGPELVPTEKRTPPTHNQQHTQPSMY